MTQSFCWQVERPGGQRSVYPAVYPGVWRGPGRPARPLCARLRRPGQAVQRGPPTPLHPLQVGHHQCWGGSVTSQVFTFFCLLLFEAIFTSFFKDKKKSWKKSQNSRNQGFSYYFCLMIEGSGSGSIPHTNGSGSGRPKTSGSGSATLRTSVLFFLLQVIAYCKVKKQVSRGRCCGSGSGGSIMNWPSGIRICKFWIMDPGPVPVLDLDSYYLSRLKEIYE